MGNYVAPSDLRTILSAEELAELISDDPIFAVDWATIDSADPNEVPEVALIHDAITAAEAEVDSYLRKRYAVPLSPVPESVRRCTIDLVRVRLEERRGITEQTRMLYERRMRWLRDVAAGRVELEIGAAETRRIYSGQSSTDNTAMRWLPL